MSNWPIIVLNCRISLFQSANEKRLNLMLTTHNLENKEKEIKVQELTIQKQRLIKNASIAGLLMILIIAFIILRNYLQKAKINKILDRQNEEIETLLLNILPETVAKELQENGKSAPKEYESVSVLFTDFKGFSTIAESLSPNVLVEELSSFFIAFDAITGKHGLEKIKTIGDAYMCAGGIPVSNETHPIDAVKAGLEMQEFMIVHNKKRAAEGKIPWDLRVGIHTGPIVAGVVGKKKYAYDIWGSTVNIASRMESNGEAGKVNISQSTYQLISEQFECVHRGKISAKNVGEIDMYFVNT
jgi:adenylate cyclase